MKQIDKYCFLPISHRKPCWSALTSLFENQKPQCSNSIMNQINQICGGFYEESEKSSALNSRKREKSSGWNVKNVVTLTTLTVHSAKTDQYWSTHQPLKRAQSIWQNTSVTISSLRIDGRVVCESKRRRSLCGWHELIVLRVLLASSERHWFRLSAVFTVCEWDHTDTLWCGRMCFTLRPAVVMSERCCEMLPPG